jgi:MFS family permease
LLPPSSPPLCLVKAPPGGITGKASAAPTVAATEDVAWGVVRVAVSSRDARPAHFWLVATVLLLFMAAGSAPTPLYVVYQQRWHFAATTLTAVFGVYALALLLALLTVGALSDFVGRRPVLAAGLVAQAAGMALFLVADGVPGLVLARVVQGLATGAVLGAISAALVDLEPPGRGGAGALLNSTAPPVGLALGGLGSGLLVQYAPAPTSLVFVVLLVAFLVLAVTVVTLPETVLRHRGALASLRPRVSVPAAERRRFWSVVPALVATWSLGGLYLSLGPSLAQGILHLQSHLTGGLVVVTLNAAAAGGALFALPRPTHRILVGGCLVLALGAAVTLIGLAALSVTGFFVGTAVAGVGFGATFLGAFRTLSTLAQPTERAELFAAVYVVSYLAYSVPAVVAGASASSVGLRPTATGYGLVVALLALLVVVLRLPRRRRQPA